MASFSRPNAQRERIAALFAQYTGEIKHVESHVFGEQLTPLTKRETRTKNAKSFSKPNRNN